MRLKLQVGATQCLAAADWVGATKRRHDSWHCGRKHSVDDREILLFRCCSLLLLLIFTRTAHAILGAYVIHAPFTRTRAPACFHCTFSYGKLSASQADLERAAHGAGAAAFISEWPEAWDHRISSGSGGMSGVSGGQAARIAVARALVRHPQVRKYMR